MKRIIKAIMPPRVILLDPETGRMQDTTLDEIEGSPRVNATIERTDHSTWKVSGDSTDPDCVGGVCPIR